MRIGGGTAMDISEYYFLAVAEELNISKAARRLYISQQCLSNHIKRLEQKYGVLLLKRKPRISLTSAGKILVDNLQQIKRLEKNLDEQLKDLKAADSGEIRMGIHTSRSHVLMPLIVPQYREKYPNVQISVIDGITKEFEKQIIDGSIDFFIGLNPRSNSIFTSYTLLEESIYLVISDKMLQTYFPSEYPAVIKRFNKGIDIHEFCDIPFIIYQDGNKLSPSIMNYLENAKVKLKTVLKTNGNNSHIELSSKNVAACFAPKMFLPSIDRINRLNGGRPRLYTFPIKELNKVNRLCLVHHKDLYIPRYFKAFIDSIIDLFEQFFEEA
jgi:DNA-binding transcriptional LysR family regulator